MPYLYELLSKFRLFAGYVEEKLHKSIDTFDSVESIYFKSHHASSNTSPWYQYSGGYAHLYPVGHTLHLGMLNKLINGNKYVIIQKTKGKEK